VITKWQKEDTKGILLANNEQLLTLLFADDQVIISNREYNLQKAAYKLNLTEHCLAITVQKTKMMTFKGRDPFSNKVVTDNRIVEKTNSFNFLEKLISYEKRSGH
jgi:hypothetical protein